MPEQFENGRKLDGKDSLQGFDAKEVCLHPKNLSVSFQKRLKMFCFRHFQVFTRCSFQNEPIRVPFSKSTVFKICRQKNVPFSCGGLSVEFFTVFKMCWHRVNAVFVCYFFACS